MPENPTTKSLRQFVATVANLTKDGECAACHGDVFEPGPGSEEPDCEDHEAFDMPSDDAVDSLHSLISRARELTGDEGEGV